MAGRGLKALPVDPDRLGDPPRRPGGIVNPLQRSRSDPKALLEARTGQGTLLEGWQWSWGPPGESGGLPEGREGS